MKTKELLNKRNIIIICILVLIIILVIYLANNTKFFKTKEGIKEDLSQLQDEISSEGITIRGQQDITNSIYSEDVGVSNGTLYIKENASGKVKESVQGTEVGYEKSNKSVNGMIVLEAYEGTSVTDYELINRTKEVVKIEVYDYNNLISDLYIMGSVTDKKQVEEGKDSLKANLVAANTEYTLTNMMNSGTNTVFFFDSDMKYLSSTTDKTFTTPENTKYIKVMTEGVDLDAIKYNLVIGKEAGNEFITSRSQITLDKENNYNGYIPFTTEKSVLYIDGADIELKYVSK